MTDRTLAQKIAEFFSSTTYDDLPDEVRSSVRDRILDTLGNSLAALGLETSRVIRRHVASTGGTGQARAIGITRRVPTAQAALVNGVLAHSLDFDDTHLPSILHPSATVIPACLAAGEVGKASGRELIRAAALGIEFCVMLGMAGYDSDQKNSLFFERGQHATSICGTVAGAAASALLAGASEEQIAHSIGLAVSMASGVLEGNRSGGTAKRLHGGWAAHGAVTAAELARGGFTGPPTVLEGRFGFFQAFLGGRFDPAPLTEGLGEHWEVPKIFFKPYPCNHFTHAGIDAAIALREKGLRIEDIQEIRLAVATPTIRTIGEPIESKRAPQSGYEAQFSGPYTVAAALLGGGGLGLDLDDFTDDLARDPIRRRLMAKVTVVADSECDAIYPNQFPALLDVKTRDGAVWTQKVLANRGGPVRPLSEDELVRKFRANAGRVLGEEETSVIEDASKRIDILEDIGELLAPAQRDF